MKKGFNFCVRTQKPIILFSLNFILKIQLIFCTEKIVLPFENGDFLMELDKVMKK